MDDIERELPRYRPAGPPRELRGRVIDGATLCRSRWREWVPAAAALIAAVLFYALAASTHSRVAARVAPFEAVDQHVLRSLIEDPSADAPRNDVVEWWLSLHRRAEQAVQEDVR